MVTTQEVIEKLKSCHDPEIPVNIVDLGLIYEVKVENEKVFVKMTLTAPGCPMHSFISQDAKQKILEIPGVEEVEVEVVWEPPWTPERMSEEGKEALGLK